jgi:hypothetical protein
MLSDRHADLRHEVRRKPSGIPDSPDISPDRRDPMARSDELLCLRVAM